MPPGTFSDRTDTSPAELADHNFATHATWAAAGLPDARVRSGAQLTLVDCGLPCDTFNFACRARLSAAEADAAIADALAFFRETGHPFSWWVGPADLPGDLGARLEAAGLSAAEGELAMAAPLEQLPEAIPLTDDLRIARATTRAELAAFAAINAANWSPPDPLVLRFYDAAADRLLAPGSPQRFYVAWLGEVPVATTEVTVTGGVAGIYGVSTVTEHRRRGIGTAVTHTALADARADGCTLGVLQAAAEGIRIYARLGFAPYGDIVEYKP